MKIYEMSIDHIPEVPISAACIGFFDSVHIGHQKLISECERIAKEKDIPAALITFDQDPGNIIDREEAFQINDYDTRLALYEHYGIDILIVIDFNEEMMKTSPKDFIRNYLVPLHLDTLVCGFDYRYGYKGEGTTEDLQNSKERNFDVVVIPEVTFYGKKISTTRIKEEIRKGNIKKAERMLGHGYRP